MQDVRAHIDDNAPQHLSRLVELSEMNSGSHNLEGLGVVASVLSDQIGELGVESQLIPTDPMEVIDVDGSATAITLGHIIRAERRRPGRPSLLLLSHYDTVFSSAHPFQHAFVDGDRLNGPGVADDKGGIVVMLAALRALQDNGLDDFGWEIILNPDEELGSPGSRAFLREAATRHDFGLVFEPSLPDGGLASRRKGSGTFHLVVKGIGAHAGRDHHLGRNAVMAATRVAQRLAALTGTRDELTINVSRIDGGSAVNIVPDRAVVRFNARVADTESQLLVERTVGELAEEFSHDGITVEPHGAFGRPPKQVTPEIETMFEAARAEASDLGFELGWHPTGGVCDGNDLAAAGLPNLDNLGPVGGGLHSQDEWVRVSSLAERAKLSAGLITRIADDRRVEA